MMAGAHDDDSDATAEAPPVASMDSLPREMLYKIIGCTAREDLEAIAVANRTFKEALYSPIMLVRRALFSLVEVSSDSKESVKKPALREARKWWEICAELHPRDSREALTMLGILADSDSGSDVCPHTADKEHLLRAAIATESQAPYVLLKDAASALDVARAELARVLMKRAGDAGDEQANSLLDEAEALVRSVLAHNADPSAPPDLVHPHLTAATIFAEIAIRRGPESSLSEALAFLNAVPENDRGGRGHWFYASGMVHKRLAGSHDDEHGQLAVRHTLTAMGKGHNRAAFEVGVMAEEGFGTTVDLTRAYLAYIVGCMARDERAIARVRELRANNDVNGHFLLAVQAAYTRGFLTEENVRGNETLDGLRSLYLLRGPFGGDHILD